jgi:hypothetical protein
VDLSLEQLSFNNWFDFPIKLKEKGLIVKAFKICRGDWIAFGDPKGEYTKQVKLLPHCRASAAFLFFPLCKQACNTSKQKSSWLSPKAFPVLSGGLDSNQRPLAPHANALPGCATTRIGLQI